MKKKINISIWWIFWILFLELIYRIFIINNLWDTSSLTVVLFSVPWILLFSCTLTLFSEKINKIINIVFTSLTTLFTLAQIVYFNFYDSMFSFFSLTTGTGQVMQFWQMIIDVVLRIWYVFLLILIPYVLFLVFYNHFIYKRLTKLNYAINVLVLALSFLGIVLLVKFDNKGIYSTKRLLLETHAPMLTIEKTGLLSMEAIDVWRYTFGFEEVLYEQDELNITPVSDSKKEYNVYNINFDTLIKDTKNSKLLSMHKYFKNVEPTEKNKYTGLFKNKNLIYITAEGFDKIAIDKDITPTLYKMANNSYIFENYYQPLFPVSTSDGEYMNLMSLIPKEGVWSFYRSSNISVPMGYGNMFKKAGYTSYGFHNHTYTYYDREVSHPNIGLSYYGCGNGLEKKMDCSHWPNSDYEMIKATTNYYVSKDKPFATYYMTVSGHLNYNFGGNSMAYRNKNAVSKLNYSTAVKAYYATQIELDKAMKLLLEELDKSGKLEDTLIIIAPDHYPYGLTFKQLNEVSKTDRSDKFENYHTALIMYNPNIEKTVINKVISSIDILPTIYNLYGLEYDSRLLMGRDIFSDGDGLVMLSDRSWVTSKGKYNSVNKKFVKTTDEELPKDYTESVNAIVYQKFSMSSLILSNDYYKKLGLK